MWLISVHFSGVFRAVSAVVQQVPKTNGAEAGPEQDAKSLAEEFIEPGRCAQQSMHCFVQ